MLSTITIDNEFKEFFFAQAAANNEACQDRSAMSLNEIYTYWRICSLPEGTHITEVLQLFERAAKTFALRKALSKAIDQHQKETGNYIEAEAVEIYLYYETLLYQKLNLLSAIENMAYATIGKRHWIDENALEAIVNSSYKKELISSSILAAFLDRNASFQKLWQPKFSDFQKRMEELTNRSTELQEGIYKESSEKLLKEQELSRKTTTLEWLNNLQDNSQ